MDLRDSDVILEVDWMFQYTPITFDFHKLVIELVQKGVEVSLMGEADESLVKLVRGQNYRNLPTKEQYISTQ